MIISWASRTPEEAVFTHSTIVVCGVEQFQGGNVETSKTFEIRETRLIGQICIPEGVFWDIGAECWTLEDLHPSIIAGRDTHGFPSVLYCCYNLFEVLAICVRVVVQPVARRCAGEGNEWNPDVFIQIWRNSIHHIVDLGHRVQAPARHHIYVCWVAHLLQDMKGVEGIGIHLPIHIDASNYRVSDVVSGQALDIGGCCGSIQSDAEPGPNRRYKEGGEYKNLCFHENNK